MSDGNEWNNKVLMIKGPVSMREPCFDTAFTAHERGGEFGMIRETTTVGCKNAEALEEILGRELLEEKKQGEF